MISPLDVIDVMTGEVGVTESPPGSNRTKYGEAYGWNGVPWCVQCLWWGFKQAGASKLFYGGGKTASCGEYIEWAKKNGEWITGGYKPGDLIFMTFSKNRRAEHVGLCMGITDNGVVTIEGNTSAVGSQSNGGMVMQKTRPLSVIVGAARPKYTEEAFMSYEKFVEYMKRYEEEQRELPPSEWASETWRRLTAEGIFDGTMPRAPLTREQAAAVIDRTRKEGQA